MLWTEASCHQFPPLGCSVKGTEYPKAYSCLPAAHVAQLLQDSQGVGELGETTSLGVVRLWQVKFIRVMQVKIWPEEEGSTQGHWWLSLHPCPEATQLASPYISLLPTHTHLPSCCLSARAHGKCLRASESVHGSFKRMPSWFSSRLSSHLDGWNPYWFSQPGVLWALLPSIDAQGLGVYCRPRTPGFSGRPL